MVGANLLTLFLFTSESQVACSVILIGLVLSNQALNRISAKVRILPLRGRSDKEPPRTRI